MLDTAKRTNVLECCLATGRLQEFQGLGYGLERCQKSLNDYLDSKRRRFPRFYFISTDELLSILGSSDPNCVQEHMIKVDIFFTYESFSSTKKIYIFQLILNLTFFYIPIISKK